MIRWRDYSLSRQQSSDYILIIFVPPTKTSSSRHWTPTTMRNEFQLIYREAMPQQKKFAMFKEFSPEILQRFILSGADNKNAKRFPLPNFTLIFQLPNFLVSSIIWSQVELSEFILKSETQNVTRLLVINFFSTLSGNLDKEFFSELFSQLYLIYYNSSKFRTCEKVSCFNRKCAKLFSNNWSQFVFSNLLTMTLLHFCSRLGHSCYKRRRYLNMKDNLFILRNFLHFARR